MWRDMRFRRLSAIDVGLAQHDHVVQQFPSTATNPALRHAVLPGTPVGRSNQLAAEAFQHPRYVSAESAITIKENKYLGALTSRKASRSCCTIH